MRATVLLVRDIIRVERDGKKAVVGEDDWIDFDGLGAIAAALVAVASAKSSGSSW